MDAPAAHGCPTTPSEALLLLVLVLLLLLLRPALCSLAHTAPPAATVLRSSCEPSGDLLQAPLDGGLPPAPAEEGDIGPARLTHRRTRSSVSAPAGGPCCGCHADAAAVLPPHACTRALARRNCSRLDRLPLPRCPACLHPCGGDSGSVLPPLLVCAPGRQLRKVTLALVWGCTSCPWLQAGVGDWHDWGAKRVSSSEACLAPPQSDRRLPAEGTRLAPRPSCLTSSPPVLRPSEEPSSLLLRAPPIGSVLAKQTRLACGGAPLSPLRSPCESRTGGSPDARPLAGVPAAWSLLGWVSC